jgi:hypothetical protein
MMKFVLMFYLFFHFFWCKALLFHFINSHDSLEAVDCALLEHFAKIVHKSYIYILDFETALFLEMVKSPQNGVNNQLKHSHSLLESMI